MRKSYKKQLSLLLAASMLTSMIQIPGYAAGMKVRSAGSENQMASEEEFVYLNAYNANTRTQNFDSNWKFYMGDAGKAEEPLFNDSAWETISLPHDYSITQEYTKSGEAESGYLPGGIGWYRKAFLLPDIGDKRVRIDFGGVYMNAVVYINGHKVGTHPYGYTSFSFDITDYIKADGENIIAVRSENKIPSSRWYSGSGIYRSVELTITDKVHVDLYGTKVETPNLEQEAAGGAVTVQTKTVIVNDSPDAATVTVKQSVIPKNTGNVEDAIGTVEQQDITIDAAGKKEVETEIQASNPSLWSVEDPSLYLLRTEIVKDGAVVECYDTEFGFRFIEFNVDEGFFLNGDPVKLKGVCMHHDQGSLGAAAYYRAMERQIDILKEMGCNAIRVTHNPADKKFMEMCNEKGMLVVEEAYDTWIYSKNGNVNDFGKWFNTPIEAGNAIMGQDSASMTWGKFDLQNYMKRDWNDPSLIMWSLGNEVMEGIAGSAGNYPATAKTLIDWAGEVDATRPVTTGENKLKGYWSEAKAIGNSLTEVGGTVGFNYSDGTVLDNYRRDYPNWRMYGAETASALNSRGIYSFRGNGTGTPSLQKTAYDEARVGWGHVASDAWYTVITRDFVAGEFVWTGFDYLGEPTPWNGTGSGAASAWPSPKSSYFGIIDTAGFPKDSYYLYQSQWNEAVDTLHILPAWNENVVYKESGNKVKVVVYSDAPSVELFFTPTGSNTPQSLGRKTFTKKTTGVGYSYQIYEGEGKSSTQHENLYLTWMVPYADGTISAKAYTTGNGTEEISGTLGRSSVTTTGAAQKLDATVDRSEIVADGKDLAYVTVDVTDSNGNIVPNADNRVTFTVEGDGELIGLDNGNSPDHDSFQADNRKAFSGKVLAIVRATEDAGSFTVTASSGELESASVTVNTTPAEQSPEGGSEVKGYRISRNYYVKTGNMPELPSEVTVFYRDGTEGVQPVAWKEIESEKIETAGSFTAMGTLEDGTDIGINISMIDEVAALMNYSAALPVGARPSLPFGRQAVMEDGTILNVQFPVEWETVDPELFDVPSTVTISGRSNVFGKEIEVSAQIRVSEEEISIGGNVASKVMKLEQNVPSNQQSDTLDAIKDGSTVHDENLAGGANKSCWTNWAYSQAGGTSSEITFTYATAERLGQAVIYYFEDTASARIPSNVELFYSRGGTEEADWEEIPFTEERGTKTQRVTPITYTFDYPVEAVIFKIKVTNSTEALSRKPCTGITEVNLNRAVGSFTVHSDAELSSLIVNDIAAPQSALTNGSYSTPALIVDTISAEAKNNGAVTILPLYEDTVRILVESEDHSKQSVFLVHLGGAAEEDPADDSRDYDYSKTTATVQNSQSGHGPERTVDDNTETQWHTRWGTTTPEADRWFILELEETQKLDGLRYFPKNGTTNGDNNGRVGRYRVETSENGTDWTEVSKGSWPDQIGWKLATFSEPVAAKYVRLWGVETYGDEARNKYMSATEIRVREALPTIDLNEEAEVHMEKEEYEIVEDGVAIKAPLRVTLDGENLKYGLDYTVSYENNTAPGTAVALVKGIIKYSGTMRKEFTILERNSQEVSVSGGRITHIDNEIHTGGTTVKLAPGHMITVEADAAPEGKKFSHWRVIPAQTEIIGATKPRATFIVPETASRLIAMYENEDGTMGTAVAISKSIPSDWFAYADEDDMEIILARALTEEDSRDILNGSKVEVALTIKRSEQAPTASPSNMEEYPATPSNMRASIATPSNMSDSMARNALLLNDSEKIGFYVSTSLAKTVKGESGNTTENISSSRDVKLTFQLPKEDSNMVDYRIFSLELEEDGVNASEITPDVDGDILSFHAATNENYVLVYTLYHTVTFVDFDDRMISEQRIEHGDAAEAPEEPFRQGYRFVGWSQEFDFVTKDITVKATYEKTGSEKPETDKKPLSDAIRKMEEKISDARPSNYTTASWDRLKQSVADAKRVVANDTATQAQIDQAVKNMEQAWNGLQRRPSSGGGSSSGGSSSSPTGSKPTNFIPATPGTWVASGDRWRYQLLSGSPSKDAWTYIEYQGKKEWYYFDADGMMLTGWMKNEAGETYYLNPTVGTEIGRLQTGWTWIIGEDGKTRCYYLQEESNGTRGKLLVNTVTPDGYSVNENGEWVVNQNVQTKS